ncbi:hypothetical protein [Mycobacterium sp. IDR2000157661]|uniref:hypothetical protein n=1 Tax=Mycobacterium sp. IDR2000157661 TaxID=2867005 RepID=UPI001EEF77E9|nr:hypothetical protein [Mycobacterium sp. IDR2000157661]ULE35863.1 hypothetical protein K3G64_20205 [Mycobacterium sp. IDR2000157661]
MLLVSACAPASTAVGPGTLRVVGSPPIPATVQEFVNPLRGQYENLLTPLFPQGNPAQRGFPAWPGSRDASLRITWAELQPADPRRIRSGTPDDRRFDFRSIDHALAEADKRGMRLTLRIMAYNSCCNATYPRNTNIAVPEWLRTTPGATRTFPPTRAQKVVQVVPEWNHPAYLGAVEQLISALGRRYDGDERLSVFEFSGYGDFSENHVAFLRDALNAPGSAPEDSVRALGYYSQYRDQSITAVSIRRLVAAHVSAFPRTQLVVTAQNPEIVRQMLAPKVTASLAAPVGIRSDCLGVYEPLPAWAHEPDSDYVRRKDRLVDELVHRLSTAPVITEWCQLPKGASLRGYYQKAVRDVVRFHVSMASSSNFPDRDSRRPMDPDLFALWSRANRFAGYRYSVEGVTGSGSFAGGAATLQVRWSNLGAAVATENWVPSYHVLDRSGRTVRTLTAAVDLKDLLTRPGEDPGGAPVAASTVDRIRMDAAGLEPGRYTIAAVVAWAHHKPRASHVVDYPPMALARAGRDASGRYPVAVLDLS